MLMLMLDSRFLDSWDLRIWWQLFALVIYPTPTEEEGSRLSWGTHYPKGPPSWSQTLMGSSWRLTCGQTPSGGWGCNAEGRVQRVSLIKWPPRLVRQEICSKKGFICSSVRKPPPTLPWDILLERITIPKSRFGTETQFAVDTWRKSKFSLQKCKDLLEK